MKYGYSLLFALLFSCVQGQNITQLAPKVFEKTLDSFANKQVIDVRTPQEFGTGYIAGAKNINYYDKDFKEQLEKLDKNEPVFVYCKVGGRSAEAAKQLDALGFTKVYELEGGMLSWARNGLPIEGYTVSDKSNSFTQTHYENLLANNKTLLIDFYAPWCIPCKQMEPSLKKLSEKYAGKIEITRINIDEAKQLTQQLNIDAIPVLSVYKNGKEIKRVNGLQSSSQIEKLIKKVL